MLFNRDQIIGKWAITWTNADQFTDAYMRYQEEMS